jgi:8-oxo-dGTP pyrophosphatase MutT (NUDIX family)
VTDPSVRRGGPQFIPRPPGARPGGPPPWAGVAVDDLRLDLARVREVLGAASPANPPPWRVPNARTAAVLIPLFEEDGELRVLLTRRSSDLRNHRGEVAFPGGGRHGDEPLVTTALREAHEEIGIDPSSVEILGELDHLATIVSGFEIVPFVGALPGRPAVHPNPAEIERVFDVPVAELLADGVFRQETWAIPVERTIAFFELEGETVWGATASILRHLLALLATGGRPASQAH